MQRIIEPCFLAIATVYAVLDDIAIAFRYTQMPMGGIFSDKVHCYSYVKN